MTEKSPVSNKKVTPDWLFHGALTRIGDTLDKLTGRRWTPSSSIATSELIERLKRLLDSEVRVIPGKGPVVPHSLRLLVQWDKFSTEGTEGLQRLENELLTAAADHINDHLYYTMSPLKLEVKQDYFVEGVKLSASFDAFAETDHEAQLSVTLPSVNLGQLLDNGAPVVESPRRAFVARFTQNGQIRDQRFEVKLGERISVGRASSNQLALDDVSVSKVHASMVVDADGNLSVADTGSTNGTFVNGERIAYGKAVVFSSGDRVRFGSVEVVFDHLEPTPQEPSESESDPDDGGVTIDGFRFGGRSDTLAADVPTPVAAGEVTIKAVEADRIRSGDKD